jgi:hypothetical protein
LDIPEPRNKLEEIEQQILDLKKKYKQDEEN